MNIVLSIDIGTSSICALALDALSRKVLCSKTLPNNANLADLPVGHHEQDPMIILQTAVSAVDAVLHTLGQQNIPADTLCGIGVTGQMHGIILLEKDLSPRTNLITWRDQRGEESGHYNIVNRNDSIAQKCGCFLQPGYGVCTLNRLIELDSQLVDAMSAGELKAAGITDFIVARLCGRVVTDTSMAASWGGFDLTHYGWDESVLNRLGIPEQVFPDVVSPASPCGPLLPHYSKRWGIGEQVIACAGVGDHQASVMACAPLQNGTCILNLGTGGQVSIVRKGFAFIEGLETRPLSHGYFLLVGSSLCGGWSYAYLAEFFRQTVQSFGQKEVELPDLFDVMNKIGATATEDAEGLVVDPRFLGSRTDQHISGSVQSIDTQNLTPRNLVRATVNGMVDELYQYYQTASLPATSLHATGNAVRRNPLLGETIADRWGIAPLVSNEKEEAAIGAACLTSVNLGLSSLDQLFAL